MDFCSFLSVRKHAEIVCGNCTYATDVDIFKKKKKEIIGIIL